MALAKEDIEQIQELINRSLISNQCATNDNIHYELELRERIVRVEEELKNQREIILQGFKQSDQRFEQIDKRFEQVDERFESIQTTMNNGFKEINRRMDRFMFWSLGITITAALFVVTYLK